MAIASDAELLHITQVYAAAMMAVIIWDWLVMIGKEYECIWKARWGLVKCLYLVSRYWTLGALSFSLWAFTATFEYEKCTKVVHWIVSVGCLSFPLFIERVMLSSPPIITVATESILAVRTYALWGRPRWLLALITVCLLVETSFLAWGSAIIKPVFPPGVPGPCVPTSGGGGNYLYFLSPFVVDSIFTGLCFYKAIQIAKVGQFTQVLRLFLRDGSIYFIVVSIANLVQTAFFIQPHVGMKVINAFAALGLSSMMCCRLVLSLKSFDAPGDNSDRYMLGGDTELSHRTATNSASARYPVLAKTETVVATDTSKFRNSVPLLVSKDTVVNMPAIALTRQESNSKSSNESFEEKDFRGKDTSGQAV